METIWNNLVVAIPSYKRSDTIQKKTLAILEKYRIPASKRYIFVADKEEEKEYKEKIPSNMYAKIIVAERGLVNARNFIFRYFPVGTPIVEMDDDILSLIEYSSRAKRHEKELEDLKSVFLRGFKECHDANCRLWGVYPIPNGFFMKAGVSTDLKFCIGSFWGCLNPGKEIQIQFGKGEKEDYQRTLQFFMADGAVVRLNSVAPKTAYYKESGGLQAFGDRLETEKKVVELIEQTWPSWVRRNPARKSGYPEIRLKDPRTKEEKQARTGLNPMYGRKNGGTQTRRRKL
jgi:hypothetical protein